MRTIAYPYVVIEDSDVIATHWEFRREQGDWQPLPAYLAEWDYSDSIRLRREVRVNMPAIARRFGCPEDQLELSLVVTFGTGGGREDRVRRVHASHAINATDHAQELDLQLEGIDISQRFSLRTQILFAGPEGRCVRLAPQQAGLRLWDDIIRVQVEPEEPRFPIEAISFESEFPECAAAPWKLDWSPADPRDEFAGSFRLLINDDFPEFVAGVSAGDPVTMRLLLGGVRLQIVRGLLDHEDLEEAIAAGEPLSIAAAVSGWLALAFPGEDLESIRQTARVNPSRLDAGITALHEGFFDDA